MGSFDRRSSNKMRQRKRQRKKKARAVRRATAVRAERTTKSVKPKGKKSSA